MTGGILFMVAIRSLTHLTKAGISALRKKENTSHRYMRDKAPIDTITDIKNISNSSLYEYLSEHPSLPVACQHWIWADPSGHSPLHFPLGRGPA
jgi:hypothetical protein